MAGEGQDRSGHNREPEFILALLDDKTRPVATEPPSSNGRDWKRPFVASEIGEALPHWEAALYLQRPERLQESARVLRHTLIFMIVAALTIIALGGWLVAADVRRQLALAQQKTDFVSNVSHELKTPLTSIRMFAELMQNGRGESAAKHPQYLRIIMVEAERLTFRRGYQEAFAKTIEQGVGTGELPPQDAHTVAAALVGALGEALVGPLAPGVHESHEALIATLVQFCLNAIPESVRAEVA